MVTKINRVLLLCLAVLLPIAQSMAHQEEAFKKFAGTYVSGHSFGGGSLTLKPDGTYSATGSSDDGTVIKASGIYAFSDGILRFTTVREVGKRMGGDKELNLLDPKERQEMFGSSTPAEINREFEMLPITWSDRIYLIDEKDLKDFVNAINLGVEPRAMLSGEPYYGSFYLRRGDEQKKVTGNPSLPEKWLSLLLGKPVTATVIEIVESKKQQFGGATTTAIIDKGSKDGLRVGTRLLSIGEEPSPYRGTEIISVTEKTATVRADRVGSELKIGDKLHTRNELKVDEYSALSWDEEKARLGKFAAHLEQIPSAQGYVIAYAGRRSREGEALARANRARVHLEKELKMEEGRIVVVDGGYREKQAVELFAVRVGVNPPDPTPTLSPAEVQIIKGKVKSSSR